MTRRWRGSAASCADSRASGARRRRLMLDPVRLGRCEARISPEAPVPIVRVRRQESRPGGAGNVVTNSSALGGRADACGFVAAIRRDERSSPR